MQKEDMERDIYISYSRWNLEKVKGIKTELEKSTGVECWMDLNAIESGSMQFTQDIIDCNKNMLRPYIRTQQMDCSVPSCFTLHVL